MEREDEEEEQVAQWLTLPKPLTPQQTIIIAFTRSKCNCIACFHCSCRPLVITQTQTDKKRQAGKDTLCKHLGVFVAVVVVVVQQQQQQRHSRLLLLLCFLLSSLLLSSLLCADNLEMGLMTPPPLTLPLSRRPV